MRCSKWCDLLWFMYFDVTRHLLYIFLQYFLYHAFVSPRVSITTGTVSVAFIPHILSLISIWRSLYFDSFFSWMFISKRRQVLSCLFLITMSGLLAFISRSVCQSLYWHLPQDCDTVFFCYCLCLYSSLCRCFGVDTGTSNDDLPLNTLKTLLRLPRVLKAF